MATAAPVDPNVKIPDAIKAIAARTEELHKAAYNPEPADGQDGDEPLEPPAREPEPRQPEPRADAATKQVEQVTTRGNEPPSDDDQTWEHKYKSIKGRFDRSEQRVAQLMDQIASLQNVIATMQVSQPSSDMSFDSVVTAERLITPEEEQDYGQDFLNVVGKKAKEELLPTMKPLLDKMKELEAKVNGVGGYVQQDAKSRMEATLDQRVPSWREINYNPEFMNWLRLPDPYSGAIRHELLKAAYQRNDTSRVAAFFNGFLSEEAAVAPGKGQPDQGNQPAKVPLETFAAPGRAKTAAAPNAPAEKPSFTRAQIAKFFADVTAGKYRGRDADKQRVELQIFEAQREGRIR